MKSQTSIATTDNEILETRQSRMSKKQQYAHTAVTDTAPKSRKRRATLKQIKRVSKHDLLSQWL